MLSSDVKIEKKAEKKSEKSDKKTAAKDLLEKVSRIYFSKLYSYSHFCLVVSLLSVVFLLLIVLLLS